MHIRSLKFKIILSTLACIILVGVSSNLIVFRFMYRVIDNRADRINELYLETIHTQFRNRLEEIAAFGIQCANDGNIRRASSYYTLSSLDAKRAALQAQTRLSSYQAAFPLSNYVNYLTVFNTQGIYIHSGKQLAPGRITDGSRLLGQLEDLYGSYLESPQDTPVYISLGASISDKKTEILAGIFPVWGTRGVQSGCFIYLELDLKLFTDVLDPYAEFNDLFLSDGARYIYAEGVSLPFDETADIQDGVTDGGRYRIHKSALPYAGLTVYSYRDLQVDAKDTMQTVYTVMIVIVSSLAAGTLLALLLTNYISRPLKRLTAKLRRISRESDFSYDPSLESSKDEIGEVGRVINEMAASIDGLLKRTRDMYEQQKNIELSLLQSQVNPHFLYNTLDSIHCMATIQNAHGAADMTRSLSNLLRNIAKGTSCSITLKEELDILDDYLAIQSVRYLESFEVHNDIPQEMLVCQIFKFTLQPIVENAIFHGIEPSGHFGVITLGAQRDGTDLVITVIDNGVGMDEQALEEVRDGSQRASSSSSLSKIGIANVNTRLKLAYGPEYGLTIESRKDSFTQVNVRIPWNDKEGDDSNV